MSADSDPPVEPTARAYQARLEARSSPAQAEEYKRYFPQDGSAARDDFFLGVRMRDVFDLSREFQAMPPGEIERLLDSRVHESRAGAVKIMAYQASAKETPEDRLRELYELYLRRHDRINDWDLVDLGAWDVVGRYLIDRPRDVLYDLARSSDPWERRTAILATLYFVRKGDLDDTYRIAEVLVNDPHDLVQKPVGGSLREAGKRDRQRLVIFLDQHAATMPRTALRYAIEHLDPEQRAGYLGARRSARDRMER